MAQEQKTEPCGCAAEMVLENLYAEGDVFVESRVEILRIHYCPLHAKAGEMREMLKDLEWAVAEREGGSCPSCRRWCFEGHKNDCELQALIDQVEGEE